MADNKQIEDLVKMLDAKASSGVSRIKVEVAGDISSESMSEQMQFGRCDIKGECVPGVTTSDN